MAILMIVAMMANMMIWQAIVSGQQMIKCFSDTETDSAPFSTFCEQEEGGGGRI